MAQQDSFTDDSDLPVDDIELAYREALKAIDAAEQQVGFALSEVHDGTRPPAETAESAFVSIGSQLADDLEGHPEAAPEALGAELSAEGSSVRVTPREVIEAALFVGGSVSLTARKLASLIGGDTDQRVAVKIIDQINEQYEAENRPYEIQLHEGGYRMQLRPEYDALRMTMFGLGPKEVRLSPEALELLAFVAWNQPVTKDDLSATSHASKMPVLRRLIRLQLVEIERTGSGREEVSYRTAPRFLTLFGLKSLEDLPQADAFAIR